MCGLVCPSRTIEREGKGYCVKGGWREEGERVKERARRSVNSVTSEREFRLFKKVKPRAPTKTINAEAG